MNTAPKRNVDFICPFVDGEFHCPEIMSPPRKAPANREKKLFVLMERPEASTKNACPHCSIFIKQWRKHVGLMGHIKYGLKWLMDKKIREPKPQEMM